MDRKTLEAEVIRAAHAWLHAKREWEATSRMLERPPNLSRLKGDVRRAERELIARLDALNDQPSGDA